MTTIPLQSPGPQARAPRDGAALSVTEKRREKIERSALAQAALTSQDLNGPVRIDGERAGIGQATLGFEGMEKQVQILRTRVAHCRGLVRLAGFDLQKLAGSPVNVISPSA